MNNTSVSCYRPAALTFPFLDGTQLVILTVTNSVVMVANIFANMLAMYILLRTGQIANSACKLFFMLSVSDLMIDLFCQNLLTTILYEKNCILLDTYAFIASFLIHLSMYTIALIGIDRYLRIKRYAKFKTLWTTKAVLGFVSLDIFLSLLQAILTLIGLLSGKENIVIPSYLAIDGVIISGITFLQILTIRTSSAVCDESRTVASENTKRKITKFSMQILLLFCCFNAPHLIIYVLREFIEKELNSYQKSLVEFFSVISSIFIYTISFANAVLFLLTNVKAKRFLRNFVRQWERSL